MYYAVLKELHLERLETYKPGSVFNANCRRVLDRFMTYRTCATRTIEEITQADLEHYLARRRQDRWRNQPLSAVTLNNEIAILNSFFAYAGPKGHKKHERHRLGLLPIPPQLSYVDEDDLEPRELTAAQVTACLQATKYARSPRIQGCSPQTFWVCALFLGSLTLLRRAALLRVPRPEDHVLIEQKRLFLPAKLNKTRRDIWLSLGSREDLAELFAALPTAVGEPLLPWRTASGRSMCLSHFNATLREFQEKAGIPKLQRVRTKDLRSTSATIIGDNFNDDVAKRKLAHSPNTHTYEKHYKGRKPTPTEVAATDFIADRLLESLRAPETEHPPTLKISG